MIDLSFLSEEEQQIILAVLQRDAELKKAEEQRVQKLQKSVSDVGQLRYLTGDWFYETKQLRHQERIHGSDIIRASMRHTYKPLTILDVPNMLLKEPSLVSGGTKESSGQQIVSGRPQERRLHADYERYENKELYETPQETPKPTKQRQNPFNSELMVPEEHGEEEEEEEKDGQLLGGTVDGRMTPSQETLKPSLPSYATNIRQDDKSTVMPREPVSVPETENTTPSPSFTDCFVEGKDPEQMFSAAPRGILKHLYGSCSTEPPFSYPDPQISVGLDHPTETWIDRKQVRFSSTVGRGETELSVGKELEKDSLLEANLSAPSETETNANCQDYEQTTAGGPGPLLKQAQDLTKATLEQQRPLSRQPFHQKTEAEGDCDPCDKNQKVQERLAGRIIQQESADVSLTATLDQEPSSAFKGSFHDVSPRPRQMLLGGFRREKEKSVQAHCPQTEQIKISKMEEPENVSDLFKNTTHCRNKLPTVNEEAKHSEIMETRTLQLTALQKTQFKDIMTSVEFDTQEEQTAETQSDLNKKSSLGTVFPREQANDNISEPRTDASHSPLDIYVETSDKNNLSPHTEMTDVAYAAMIPPQNEGSLITDIATGDGTYRANPVMICEETDDSLAGPTTESQIFELEDKTISCFSITVPPHRQTSSNHQGESPASNNDLKYIREKECTGPRGLGAGDEEASDRRTSLDSTEKSEEDTRTCPYPFKMWASPDKSPVRSPGATEERSGSPSKCPTSRSTQQEDEVKRSPSKTCHPRVLHRESSSPKRSQLEGSFLKAFPIDFHPQTKDAEELLGQPTPLPRQKKSPSHNSKQPGWTDSKTCPGITSSQRSEAKEFYFVNPQQRSSSSCTAPPSKKSPENSGTSPGLVRSFIPQSYEHYLGPQERAYIPAFHQDKVSEGSPVTPAGDDAAAHDASTHGNTSQDTTRTTWSPSQARSCSNDGYAGAVMQALKRLSSKSMSSSKSLENIVSQTTSSHPSSATTVSDTQIKNSVSVPVLQQDETDSDSTVETTFSWRRNTGSSISNLSLSSGMASMSSVSGSISSLYSAHLGDLDVQGSIQFAVNYIQKSGEFHIFVVLCRDLAAADAKKNRSDPYVKCYLVPDQTKLGKRKTTVKKKTLNPTYNEILRFKIKMEVLKTQSLNISVWHNDTFGRNSFLGEVELDMSDWDFSNTQINEYALKDRVSEETSTPSPAHAMTSRGQMRVAMRFLPQTSHSRRTSRMETGEVQIWVKDCKNLPPVRGLIIDPFVKCTVLPDTSQRSRQKTRVVKRTANPMFNHTMVYDGFRPDDLREACVEITVWDHDRLKNHYIGGVRLGLGTGKSYGVDVVWMDSTADEAHLWQRMLQSGGEWVEDVLPLRMLVMTKSTSK